MKKLNYARVVLGGFAAAITFMVVEFIVEGVAYLMFRTGETELWQEAFGAFPTGARFQAVNLLVLLAICIVMIWVYAVFRAYFGPGPRTAIITALVLWLFLLLVWVNFVNLGVFPVKIAALSLVFTLLEIPSAAVVGAAVYKEKDS